ncbi:MAG: thioredoxin family protein [Bacteroidales bacterium]
MKIKYNLLINSLFISIIGFSLITCNRTGDKKENDKVNGQAGVISLTAEDFRNKVWNYKDNPRQWVFEGQRPAVVDFYADWCAPCKTASPILEELAQKYQGKVDFYKVNTDNEQEVAKVFGISTIPSFLWIPKEGEPQMTAGIAPGVEATRKMFTDMIENQVLGNFKSEEVHVE